MSTNCTQVLFPVLHTSCWIPLLLLLGLPRCVKAAPLSTSPPISAVLLKSFVLRKQEKASPYANYCCWVAQMAIPLFGQPTGEYLFLATPELLFCRQTTKLGIPRSSYEISGYPSLRGILSPIPSHRFDEAGRPSVRDLNRIGTSIPICVYVSPQPVAKLYLPTSGTGRTIALAASVNCIWTSSNVA